MFYTFLKKFLKAHSIFVLILNGQYLPGNSPSRNFKTRNGTIGYGTCNERPLTQMVTAGAKTNLYSIRLSTFVLKATIQNIQICLYLLLNSLIYTIWPILAPKHAKNTSEMTGKYFRTIYNGTLLIDYDNIACIQPKQPAFVHALP